MQVLTYRSGGHWQSVAPPRKDENGRILQDDATAEISRSLSDCFRCSNLVVLTGLGTSLHVNTKPPAADSPRIRVAVEGKRIAPTMSDLWAACRSASGDDFPEVVKLARLPEDLNGNIEALLSYCKVAEAFIDEASQKKTVTDFITIAEETVRDQVRFLEVEDDVGLHANFLRRLVRRSTRKLRTKLFTMNRPGF